MGYYYVKPHLVCRSTHRIKNILFWVFKSAQRCVFFGAIFARIYHYLWTQFTLHIVVSIHANHVYLISMQPQKIRLALLWWDENCALLFREARTCACVMKLKKRIRWKTHMKIRALIKKINNRIFEENDEGVETPKIKGKCGAKKWGKKNVVLLWWEIVCTKIGSSVWSHTVCVVQKAVVR